MSYVDILKPGHPASVITVVGGKIIPRETQQISAVPLAKKKEQFFEHVARNYSRHTIENYHWCVSLIIRAGKRDFSTYNRLLIRYKRPNIRCYIIQTLLYDFYDILPSAGRLDLSPTYYQLNLYYQNFLDQLIRCRCGKVKPSTINMEIGKTARFCRYLEKCGITDIHDITDRIIREYASYGNIDNDTIHKIGYLLKEYALFFSDNKLLEIHKLFPNAKPRKRVYQPLSKSEMETFEAFLNNPKSDISKRDRAIGLLIYHNGFRSSDITEMKRSDINLTGQTIHIVQKKTGIHLHVPVIPIVSNAIVDYVRNERPRSDSPLLFISPHVTLKGKIYKCNVYRVINRIFVKCGIRSGKCRKGAHLLRHALIDRMINRGEDIATISSIVGHRDPNVTIGYVSTNIEQLRACALPIKDYPIKSKLYE